MKNKKLLLLFALTATLLFSATCCGGNNDSSSGNSAPSSSGGTESETPTPTPDTLSQEDWTAALSPTKFANVAMSTTYQSADTNYTQAIQYDDNLAYTRLVLQSGLSTTQYYDKLTNLSYVDYEGTWYYQSTDPTGIFNMQNSFEESITSYSMFQITFTDDTYTAVFDSSNLGMYTEMRFNQSKQLVYYHSEIKLTESNTLITTITLSNYGQSSLTLPSAQPIENYTPPTPLE